MVDAVDAPLDRLIALFGFDEDRCRILGLAGTQPWRDRRRGAGNNIVIVGSVQMFLLSTLSTHSYQGKTTQLFLPQHHCNSVHVSPFCQYYLLSNVLTSEDHAAGHYHSPMVMWKRWPWVIFCQSLFINVYEQYCLLSVTVHQCIWAVLSTVSHRPSMYMSSIVYCQSHFISVFKQYHLLSVTVHQCIWAVLPTVSHTSSVYISSIIYCQSPSINVYEQYCLLSVTLHQCI